MKYVIVGNSFAAVFAVEAIRKTDPKGGILIISDEARHTYSRAMIHEYLAGLVDDRLLDLRERDFYERLGVETLLGQTVTRIDTAKKTVSTDGRETPYEKLLLAVGGSPIVPPGIEGLDRFMDVYRFTTLRDCVELRKAADRTDSVVVLGGGLIGMQCAEGLCRLGKKVHVVELMPHILPLALDEISAAMVRRGMESAGVEFHTEDTVAALRGSRRQLAGVTLKSGLEIECGAFVVAIGVRPNLTLTKGTPVRCDRGILVDEHMETSVPGVFAAGDCAQAVERLSGKTMPIPIIPVASEQGEVAGYNMAGRSRTYRGALSLNALQFGGLPIISYGQIKNGQEAEVLHLRDDGRGVYKKLVLRGGKMVGALLVRDIRRAGLFRHLIEEGVPVAPFREALLAEDFGYAHLPRALRDELFTVPQ